MALPISASRALIMRTAAIALASGKSERMGQNKLLLRLNDETLIDNVLNAVATSNIDETIVVLGHDHRQIIQTMKPRLKKVSIVINEDYELG